MNPFKPAFLARALARALCVALGYCSLLRADWKEDTGWNQLAAELGAAMPAGAGVAVLHVEADGPGYLAQGGGPGSFAGAGVYAGKTFHPLSGQGPTSGHAAMVASYWYRNDTGAAPAVTDIHAQRAVDFVFDSLLAGAEATVLPGLVQNHSWVGGTGNAGTDVSILRRFDHMIQRDGRIAVAGLRNDTQMAALLGNAYHGIVAGLRSGAHSRGGSNVDGAGRMKPDLVAGADLTSNATAVVSGIATLLMQGALASGASDAARPEVIKAVLLAGASKQRIPGWRRLSSQRPYDEVLGAGEVNALNAWRIHAAGRHISSGSEEVPLQGWDFALTAANGVGRLYFFSVPQGGAGQTCSAALTWHRAIDLEAGTALLPDLTLKLWAADHFVKTGGALAVSDSAVDNVEHVFLRNLPPGQYALEVTAAAEDVPYSVAWQVVTGLGPRLAVRKQGAQLWLDTSGLDPWTLYQIESNTTLTGNWSFEGSFRTADTAPSFEHSWEDVDAPSGAIFYRLRWTPVR